MYLLLVAFYLSILSFYLGVLIYALPIPVPGLKRWGPRLINDAFFIATLTLTIHLIISFADYLRSVLGGDWSFFFNYIKGAILLRSNSIIFLSIIRDILSAILPGTARILSTGLDMLTASMYALLLLYFLALIAYYGIGTIAPLGLTLMSIPFRIARNAGAFILSFALVFYLALPLYPSFVVLLSTPIPSSSLDFVIVYGDIYTDLGYKITEGFVGIMVNGEYIGPAKVMPGGRITIFLPRKYLTSLATLYFDASSHRFYTNVTNIALTDICSKYVGNLCKIDVIAKGIIYYSKGLTIHMRPQPTLLDSLKVDNNRIMFTVYVDSSAELYISAVEAYNIVKVAIGNTTIENMDRYKAYSWVWYNVPGDTYVISIPSGVHTICIEYNIVSMDRLEPEIEHIYPVKIFQLDLQSLGNVIELLAYSVYFEVISSILYLSLLMSITYGLTRLLGGSARLRLVP